MLAEDVQKHLLKSEKVVWVGRPIQGFVLTGRDGWLIPFGLVWGGFVIFWEFMVLQMKPAFPMALAGVPFLLVAFFMLIGRFVVDAWLRGRIQYVLTDQRALIVRSPPWPSFKAISLDRLAEVAFLPRADGRGTIRFGPPMSGFGTRNAHLGFWVAALDQTPQFYLIGDAQRVFKLCEEQAQRPL